jgi:hypothetical protein
LSTIDRMYIDMELARRERERADRECRDAKAGECGDAPAGFSPSARLIEAEALAEFTGNGNARMLAIRIREYEMDAYWRGLAGPVKS